MTTSATFKKSGEYETVLVHTKGHVCYITLNRPSVLNARNRQLIEDLHDACAELDRDPELWVGILSGAGRAFCSGADLRGRVLGVGDGSQSRRHLMGYNRHNHGLPPAVNWKPMIAAVHGYAVGAGYELMQACDLVVAAADTRFQIAEARRGIGGSQLWAATWFAGGGRFANEIGLTDRMFIAEEALKHGLINRVVPASELMATAEGLAEQIIQNPPLSVRCNVRVMRHFAEEMKQEAEIYQDGLNLSLTEDARESARAFVEKRRAIFQGR